MSICLIRSIIFVALFWYFFRFFYPFLHLKLQSHPDQKNKKKKTKLDTHTRTINQSTKSNTVGSLISSNCAQLINQHFLLSLSLSPPLSTFNTLCWQFIDLTDRDAGCWLIFHLFSVYLQKRLTASCSVGVRCVIFSANFDSS